MQGLGLGGEQPLLDVEPHGPLRQAGLDAYFLDFHGYPSLGKASVPSDVREESRDFAKKDGPELSAPVRRICK